MEAAMAVVVCYLCLHLSRVFRDGDRIVTVGRGRMKLCLSMN